MIYIDFTECIPRGAVQFHGGANYGKRMLDVLARAYKIGVLLPCSYTIDSDLDKKVFGQENVEIIRTVDLTSFNGFEAGDILFIPLLPARHFKVIRILKQMHPDLSVYLTIHGVRRLDLKPDYLDLYYENKSLKKINYIKECISYYGGGILYKKMFQKYIRMFDKVFTVSNDTMQKVQSICRPKEIKLFYEGSINADVGTDNHAGTCGNYALIVSGGRSEKNLLRTLMAFQKFKRQDGTNLKLIVTGINDERKQALLNCPLLEREVLERYVDFLPYVHERKLQDLYKNCRFTVYVSKSEGFGLPLIEACMYEIPVMTSSITAMPEVLQSGAYYVNPKDIDSIARGFEKLSTGEYEVLRKQIARRKKLVQLCIENSDEDFILEFRDQRKECLKDSTDGK